MCGGSPGGRVRPPSPERADGPGRLVRFPVPPPPRPAEPGEAGVPGAPAPRSGRGGRRASRERNCSNAWLRGRRRGRAATLRPRRKSPKLDTPACRQCWPASLRPTRAARVRQGRRQTPAAFPAAARLSVEAPPAAVAFAALPRGASPRSVRVRPNASPGRHSFGQQPSAVSGAPSTTHRRTSLAADPPLDRSAWPRRPRARTAARTARTPASP